GARVEGIGNELLDGLVRAGVQPHRKQLDDPVTEANIDAVLLGADGSERGCGSHGEYYRTLGPVVHPTNAVPRNGAEPRGSPGGRSLSVTAEREIQRPSSWRARLMASRNGESNQLDS